LLYQSIFLHLTQKKYGSNSKPRGELESKTKQGGLQIPYLGFLGGQESGGKNNLPKVEAFTLEKRKAMERGWFGRPPLGLPKDIINVLGKRAQRHLDGTSKKRSGLK